jgi:DNA-binding beta-propeller fold protein YncE
MCSRYLYCFCCVFQGPLLFPSIVGNITGTEVVRGLTVFNGQLFVTRSAKTSDQVSVYNTPTLELVRNITVVGAAGIIYGLAVSSDNNYLYVADQTNSRLFKVNLSSSSTVANWTVATYVFAMSLNSLQNILLATSPGKIQEYTPIGSLVREVITSASTYRAVEVSQDVLAVSLYTMNQVNLMHVNGTVLYSSVASGTLFSPRCLGVDKKGYVFVADFTNNRVVVLNPTLTVARPLRVTGNVTVVITSPSSLFLDPSTGYLYVGEGGSPYRVIVFDVSHVSTLFGTP